CQSSHFSLYFVLGSEDKLELFLFSHTQIYSVLAAFLLLIFLQHTFQGATKLLTLTSKDIQ
ncbi:hypothetical protein QG083_10185, partial [Kingella kingae]|uniref:hypothetical protein n=1 Tax=Kingella kingae TaxID=504 RepID=UPI00254CD495